MLRLGLSFSSADVTGAKRGWGAGASLLASLSRDLPTVPPALLPPFRLRNARQTAADLMQIFPNQQSGKCLQTRFVMARCTS